MMETAMDAKTGSRAAIALRPLAPNIGVELLGIDLVQPMDDGQFAAIRAALSRRTPMPTAILGDFNDWSRRGSGGALGSDFRMHSPGASFPATRPMGALDRIAIGGGLHIHNAGVHTHAPASVASDHLPIWVDVRIDG